MEEIPSNCILSKGTTGCGATTLATVQNIPTLIAMPFVELIDNKAQLFPDNRNGRPVLLPIYGEGDKTREIRKYMDRHGDLPKIATTYDSVPKVCSILNSLGYDPYGNMHLCVDEWHLLFNHYSFRNMAIRNLLAIAKDFGRVTYISATPIERAYWLEELMDMPEYRLKGENIGSNYHIFLNSVEGIYWIIRNAGLTPGNTRVVCSQSSGKQNTAKLHGFPISRTADQTKMFNFYTSTAFEGCDIYDERGRTFIVSEPYKTHTMPDLSTSFIQIAGRVRNSIYGGEVIHLYGATGNQRTVSPDEFERATWEAVEKTEHDLEHINALSEDFRASIIRNLPYINEPYVIEDNGKLIVDRRAKATDMGQWYDTVTFPKRIDGKNVSCMTIIRSRFVRSDF